MSVNLGTLTRREFGRLMISGAAGLIATQLPIPPVALANDKEVKTIQDIPGLSVEVKD